MCGEYMNGGADEFTLGSCVLYVCMCIGECVGVYDIVCVCIGVSLGVGVVVCECVGVTGGVGSINDGSGSDHRSLTLVFPLCFDDGVRLRQKTALLCFGMKSAPLSLLL